MSAAASGLPVAAESSPAGGLFSSNFHKFVYTTPQGTHVLLQIVGRGSLEGTTVDSSGALHLLFSQTNSFTKIMSDVHGGTGQAALASIYSRDLFEHGAANSLSGIGATLIGTINLPKFNLLAGGTVNVTSGINNPGPQLGGSQHADSAPPDSRQPGAARRPRIDHARTTGTTTTTGSGLTSGTGSSTANGINNNFITNAFLVQTLAGSTGEFVSAGNILNVTVQLATPARRRRLRAW